MNAQTNAKPLNVSRNHKITLKTFVAIIVSHVFITCSLPKKSYYAEQPGVNLYAFVGKKVRMEKFDATVKGPITRYYDKEFGDTVSSQFISLSLDNAYHCTYEVCEPVFNRLPSDTVSFDAYSHYYDLGFDRSDYVLLYLSKDSAGTFYQQRYQYDLLTRTSTGYVGSSGRSIKSLFNRKRVGVFSNRGLF